MASGENAVCSSALMSGGEQRRSLLGRKEAAKSLTVDEWMSLMILCYSELRMVPFRRRGSGIRLLNAPLNLGGNSESEC